MKTKTFVAKAFPTWALYLLFCIPAAGMEDIVASCGVGTGLTLFLLLPLLVAKVQRSLQSSPPKNLHKFVWQKFACQFLLTFPRFRWNGRYRR